MKAKLGNFFLLVVRVVQVVVRVVRVVVRVVEKKKFVVVGNMRAVFTTTRTTRPTTRTTTKKGVTAHFHCCPGRRRRREMKVKRVRCLGDKTR